MMSVSRASPLFAVTVTRIEALPLPFDGDRVAQGCSLTAVHEQALCVRTWTVATPAVASSVVSGPLTL